MCIFNPAEILPPQSCPACSPSPSSGTGKRVLPFEVEAGYRYHCTSVVGCVVFPFCEGCVIVRRGRRKIEARRKMRQRRRTNERRTRVGDTLNGRAAELVALAKRSGRGMEPVKVRGILRCSDCGHISVGHWTAAESLRDGLTPGGCRYCQMCGNVCPAPAVGKPRPQGFQPTRSGLSAARNGFVPSGRGECSPERVGASN